MVISTHADIQYAIANPDFEEGSLAGWNISTDGLAIEASTNAAFNRYYSARIHGAYAQPRFVTNTLRQTFSMSAGDIVSAIGFLWWRTNVVQSGAAKGELTVRFNGPVQTTTNVWTNTTQGWTFFEIYGGPPGAMNGGFEDGSLKSWMAGADHLNLAVQRTEVVEGQYALRMYGAWSNGWSWNHVSQGMTLSSGEIATVQAKMKIAQFTKSGGWAAAGIKLEDNCGNTLVESALLATTNTSGWIPLSLSYSVPSNGYYVFRCFVAGNPGDGAAVQADVYFDDVRGQRKPISTANGDFEAVALDGGLSEPIIWWPRPPRLVHTLARVPCE